ncbi:MAG: hypothetical protein DRO14_06530 [Thermoprotei archaeon]|nr:MAG: hypothetical protein DRO14_06530 [Thermoprotei archaeon]
MEKIDYEAAMEIIPELAEYLPRKTRRRIFLMLYEHFEKRAKKLKESGESKRPPVIEALAEEIGVNPLTITYWKGGRFAPTGVSIWGLLEAALKFEPEKTLEILREDLERHRELIEMLMGKPQNRERKGWRKLLNFKKP